MTRLINVVDAPYGWANDPRYVYIGRPGVFGNPHPMSRLCETCGVLHSRTTAIAAFEVTLAKRLEVDADFAAAMQALRGKILVCPGRGCGRDKRCHGEVYVRRLEG